MGSMFKAMRDYSLFVNIMIFFFTFLSTEDFTFSYTYTVFGMTPQTIYLTPTGFITTIVVVLGIAAIAGIGIFGSGLNDRGTQVAITLLITVTVWFLFSLFTLSLLSSAGVFGELIYITLTVLFGIGTIGTELEKGSAA